MRPLEVQYLTREMIARLQGPESLLRMALTEAAWERAAARWLLVMTAWLLGVVAVGLWVVGI